MTFDTRAHKVDANQKDIVDALRACGCSVLDTSTVGHGFVDIVVGRNGVNYCLEIKTEIGRLNAKQVEWHELWRGQRAVIRSIEDAFAAVGIEVVA